MPKIPTDYSKTIMYKIVCKDLNIKDCYVGHTVNYIKRKSSHKTSCNNQNYKEYNYNVYKFIRENGGWQNWDIIEIKKYPCNDKREAEAEERRLYEELNANLNNNRPCITENEKKKQIKEKQKIKIECECGSKICKGDLSKHLKTKKHINYINNINKINL